MAAFGMWTVQNLRARGRLVTRLPIRCLAPHSEDHRVDREDALRKSSNIQLGSVSIATPQVTITCSACHPECIMQMIFGIHEQASGVTP